MPQEFLASFAVDIDESGVNRLQRVLEQNRELASSLSSAFDSARSAMQDFVSAASEELLSLPIFSNFSSVMESSFGGYSMLLPLDMDFARATKTLNDFIRNAPKELKLTADASAVINTATDALNRIRNQFASTTLSLKAKVNIEAGTDTSGIGGATGSAGAASSGPARSPGLSMMTGNQVPLMLSSGGRFSSPTRAEIAEDGGTEYVIPVDKEERAVPLLRQLMGELSATARDSLREALGDAGGESMNLILPAAESGKAPGPLPGETIAEILRSSLSDLSGLLASAPDAAAPAANPPTVNHVQAPVSINVTATQADPERIGRSIYDAAERYLLRTLEG